MTQPNHPGSGPHEPGHDAPQGPPTVPPPAAGPRPDDGAADEPADARGAAGRRPRSAPGGRRLVATAALSALAASALTLGGGAVLLDLDRGGTGGEPGAEAPAEPDASSGDAQATAVVDSPDGEPASVEEIAEAVGPAVASVEVTMPGPPGAARTGTGSAVVLRPDGHLLTNAHVVDGAESITVQLASGESHEAEVVGADARSDLAVLQVDADGLPAPRWADQVPPVGQQVVAIGSPFGLEGSVTSGIVSAQDRTLSGQGSTLTGMIQTDAAINPGNSGGALVDDTGTVVGINTAIYSGGQSGGNDGVGFAVPASTATEVAEQLIDDGEVTWPQIGVAGGDVNPRVAQAYDLPTDAGALIARVGEGTPAAEAGLEPGDIVTAIDGEPVESMSDLAVAVMEREIGDEVVLEVLRGDERREVTAELAPTG